MPIIPDSASDISEHKYLFHEGRDYRSYEMLGAHRFTDGGGWVFRVWAPRAAAVSLVGDFNGWSAYETPMYRLSDDGSIWELVTDALKEGDAYKFVITAGDGRTFYKADPYAFLSEDPRIESGSMRASRLYDIRKGFDWSDEDWISMREKMDPYTNPMSIYEVHLGSWKRDEEGCPYNYRRLADELIPYVKDMGYTHMELLPLMEHPFDGSWGYQVTGYYSITSRYGSPDDFKYFVNEAHAAGIGVILDWVPAHFPKDDFGLVEFDGEPLFEYTDPLKKEHKGWGTLSFDFGRPEVVSFLVSNACYYCEMFHVDGLRVDAVAAMLYLNYDRTDEEWRPNVYGGIENLEAVAFLQRLNEDLLTNYRGVLMIAEESTSWANVTKPPGIGGLGFNFKWSMGWMNDVLSYFESDPVYRGSIHHRLTFSLVYAYSENFILPISHDEVVHGKKSLLDKMHGEYEDKFAGMRSFLTYMFTHPGKKLLFMGSEFGQFSEWTEQKGIDFELLRFERHAQMQSLVRDLNRYYKSFEPLWLDDNNEEGFEWVDADNYIQNVYLYLRKTSDKDGKMCIVALNLSGVDYDDFILPVKDEGTYVTAIDTDDQKYGGRGLRPEKLYHSVKGEEESLEHYITLRLPKLSAIVLEKR